MSEQLNQFLAEKADALVRENFTGVRAEWWWERRIGGGIEVCQELDPEAMSREISERTGKSVDEVRRAVEEELGLEDPRGRGAPAAGDGRGGAGPLPREAHKTPAGT